VSPTQRSLAWFRDRGWYCEVVERWIPGANIRRDLFGFADILAVKGSEIVLVQTTTEGVAERVRKCLESPGFKVWTSAPGRLVVVHGWCKRANGRRELREEWLTERPSGGS
jgi:hypothetical protein